VKKFNLLFGMMIVFLLVFSTFVSADYNAINQSAKLVVDDAKNSDSVGYSASIYGDYLIMGTPIESEITNSGVSYIFERDGFGIWSQNSELIPADGINGGDFGFSVSVSGDYAVSSAQDDNDKGTQSGSVYVYKKTGGTWVQVDKLTAYDGTGYEYYGTSVSISGDYIVVGSPNSDMPGNSNCGAVYIYKRNVNDTFDFITKLIAYDYDGSDKYGTAVAIDGYIVAIGSVSDDVGGSGTGSVYIYERNETDDFNLVSKVGASDREVGDALGKTVAVYGDYVVASALNDDNGTDSGSVYIFQKNASKQYEQIKKLIASDGAAGDLFGSSISIYGNYTVVGAYVHNGGLGANSGSAYVYKYNETSNWDEFAVLKPDTASDQFGFAVSIYDDTILVTSRLDGLNNYGAGYIYTLFENVTETPSEPESLPNVTTFDYSYGTTNFSALDNLTSVPSMTLATQLSKIVWNNDVNAENADFDSNVKMGYKFVSVNSESLDSSINSSAEVTLQVEGCDTYTIYYAEQFYDNFDDIKANGQVCDAGSEPSCTDITCVGNILTFTAEHFDGYGGEGGLSAVPEFSTITMLIALVGVIGGFMFIRREN